MICLLTFAVNRDIIVTVKDITHPAKREKGNTMINISTKTINPTARYRVTMTDPIDGSAEERIMIGADLKQTAYAIGHLYDINAELIPDTKQGTQTPDTAETEQDAETTPAAEPETETAERAEKENIMKYIDTTKTPAAETVTTQRAAEIADALDDIRRERAAYGYRTKQRVTARCIREAESAGRPTVRVGYCDLQGALSGITPDYYTAGVYGWSCDVYTIAGLTICTGYRPAAGVRAVGVRELADACRGADAATRDRLLAAWIVTNREIAREGARA